MRIFIEAQDLEIWDAIETGPFVPTEIVGDKTIIKRRDQWTPNDKIRVQADLKAKNILTSALGFDEFFRVSNCNSAKEMWDTLQITHEGTDEVKRSRLNALSQEYELFRMMQGESIVDMQKRFTHLINHLMALGKTYTVAELNMKILRSLTREWQPKVTAISEKKSLSRLPLAALFGKLQEHELELSRLDRLEESENRKNKSIALKATKDVTAESSSSSDEEINLLAKKFSRFLKKNSRRKFKKPETSSKITCFECGKQGHIKTDCPDLKKSKKTEKKEKKPRRAYLAWEDNDSTASSSSSDIEEQVNLCLMADDSSNKVKYFSDCESFSDSSSDSTTSSQPSYENLQNAFQELLEESIKLGKENSLLKSEKEALALKNTELKQELEFLEIQYECLDNLAKIDTTCNNCSKLQIECDKFKGQKIKPVKPSVNRTQKPGFTKYGLGYVPNNKKTHRPKVTDPLSSVFVKAKNEPICTYCCKHGHINTVCYYKLVGVPKGRYEWVVKPDTHKANHHGLRVTWTPA